MIFLIIGTLKHADRNFIGGGVEDKTKPWFLMFLEKKFDISINWV